MRRHAGCKLGPGWLAVLQDEQSSSSVPGDPPHLAERDRRIGAMIERPQTQSSVEGRVGKRQALGVPLNECQRLSEARERIGELVPVARKPLIARVDADISQWRAHERANDAVASSDVEHVARVDFQRGCERTQIGSKRLSSLERRLAKSFVVGISQSDVVTSAIVALWSIIEAT